MLPPHPDVPELTVYGTGFKEHGCHDGSNAVVGPDVREQLGDFRRQRRASARAASAARRPLALPRGRLEPFHVKDPRKYQHDHTTSTLARHNSVHAPLSAMA